MPRLYGDYAVGEWDPIEPPGADFVHLNIVV